MGNCCFPTKKNELYTSLISSESYELNTSNSQILNNNIKEINDRIFVIEEKCGTLFTKLSDDINYLNNKVIFLEAENQLRHKLSVIDPPSII